VKADHPITVRCLDGKIVVKVTAYVFDFAGESVRLKASVNLDIDQGHALMDALSKALKTGEARADKARMAKERHDKWLEREINAGRMVVYRGPGRDAQ
jgi:hypothetical protein